MAQMMGMGSLDQAGCASVWAACQHSRFASRSGPSTVHGLGVISSHLCDKFILHNTASCFYAEGCCMMYDMDFTARFDHPAPVPPHPGIEGLGLSVQGRFRSDSSSGPFRGPDCRF
eukprot:3788404-Rhodomonas_salina.5